MKQKLVRNKGDRDLEKYFNPLIKKIKGKLNWEDSMGGDVISRLEGEGLLDVFGYGIWGAIHNATWRIREAAAIAVFNYSKAPIKKKYEQNKKLLFQGFAEIAQIICSDKVSQIYLIGLDLINELLKTRICDKTIPKSFLRKFLNIFVNVIAERIT